MQTQITFRHMDSSPALREYVESKLDHIQKHLVKAVEVHVILSVQKHIHKAEIVLHEQNLKASASETSNDMYKSIDSAMQKIEVQVRKFKDKRQEHHKHHEPLHETAAHAEEAYQRAKGE